VPVLPLPGASSLLLALAASGLNGQSFAFVGYLPQEAGARAARIRELEALSRRLAADADDDRDALPQRALLAACCRALQPATRLSVSCGLTLPGGWTRTDSVAGWRKAPGADARPLPAVFACWLADAGRSVRLARRRPIGCRPAAMPPSSWADVGRQAACAGGGVRRLAADSQAGARRCRWARRAGRRTGRATPARRGRAARARQPARTGDASRALVVAPGVVARRRRGGRRGRSSSSSMGSISIFFLISLLDVAHHAHVVARDQRHRQARGAGAAGAADAVHVVLGVERHVEVEDRRQVGDVQAARGHVGGHQQVHLAGLEGGQRLQPLVLALVAVQRLGAQAVALERARQARAAELGVDEDERLRQRRATSASAAPRHACRRR
jgi:hypothetical protein